MKKIIFSVFILHAAAGMALAQPAPRSSDAMERFRQLAPAQERVTRVNSRCERGWAMCERGSSQWCIPRGCACGTMPGSWTRTAWCQR